MAMKIISLTISYRASVLHVLATLLMLVCNFDEALSQNAPVNDPRDQYQLQIRRTISPIELDGTLSEEAWAEADVATDFWVKFPRDDIRADRKTEVRATYDDRNLYISAVCYDTSFYVVQTLKRDTRFFEGDGFGVVLDPVNRRSNGFLFGVSPMNVQVEDLLSTSGFGQLNFSWDNKWFSAVGRYEDRWIVEMAIPFKTLRFESANTTWGVNFFRNDLKTNRVHSWTRIPVNFEPTDIGYTGAMIWDAPPRKTGANISLIPYMTGSAYWQHEAEPPESDYTFDAGGDAKVAITSSLNLDLTVNPDFSQIDVDVQQTNLTRFSLQFPERRAFFLENSDLFANFGTPPARPIFTRSIGLDSRAQPIPILYGARLSGNLNDKLRVGLMNLQTRSHGDDPGQNYSIAAFSQTVLKRSLIKGYATNRQAWIQGEGFNEKDYGRNAGLELNYRNLSGTWNPWVALHVSGTPEEGFGTFRNGGVRYSGRNFSYFLDYIGIDTDYYADMGFIPRLNNYDAKLDTIIRMGYEHIHQNVGYTIRPEGGKFNAHEFSAVTTIVFNPDWTLNDRSSSLEYQALFRNTSQAQLQVENNDVRLLFYTGFTDADPLPPGTYKFTNFQAGYTSDARRAFALETELQAGQFYNGHLFRYLIGLTYRAQPWGNFSLTFEQSNVRFPDPYGEEKFFLINQRTEINFSTSIFWTTFIQYNTQNNNVNINSRLQWRYSPMSDFFLVYTDNYYDTPFLKGKNRGVVFKVNYWFTL